MMSAAYDDVLSFRQRLRAAYRRAEEYRNPRRWTLEQPPWWVDTSTVALRRALTADQRAVWLRRQVG